MIHQFFGLREQPFGGTPDPRYLYLGTGHREALASLFCGIETNRGFLALIAQPGMGKTTLLFHLLQKFHQSASTAFLFHTQCNSRELLRFLFTELGIESQEDDHVRMHDQFNRYLMEQSSANRRVIVVIDEAQNLKPSVLETVRLLSNFETPRAKLLQIILSGQPELATKLASPSLSQLRQRIASFNGLDPLGPEDVARFIDHRLRVARYQGPPLFSDQAKAMIADLSKGIPRNINSLCYGALSLACALRQQTIDTNIVREVFGDQDLQKLIPHSQRVATTYHSKNWASPAAKLKVASLSRAPQLPLPGRPAEATPAPTLVVSSEIPSDLDGARHDGDTGSARANCGTRSPIKRKSVHSLLSRVIGLAMLVLLIVSGTAATAPVVVNFAAIWSGLIKKHVAPPNVKISNTKAVRPTPTKPRSEQVPNPTVTLAELSNRLKEKGLSIAESRATAPAVETAHAWSQPNPEKTTPPSRIRIPNTEAERLTPGNLQTEPVRHFAVDPDELWKRVKEGSTSAEAKLAALYMEGSGVEQNCEQAHLLLEAASRKDSKDSKVASDLLHGEYTERCH